ncbi:hypothetical protein BC941DRAFT_490128, partial [Chlamydoabsidia padenii]
KERKYGNQKLFQVHTLFFLDFFEKKSNATLNEARKAVMESFPGLEIGISAISKHIKKHCNLTMKKLEKLPAARNSDFVLESRKEKITWWKTIADFHYMNSCVFIDEAGFNLHISRTFGRSKKRIPCKNGSCHSTWCLDYHH